ncbi:DUF4249 domain-containing protein [Pseudoflavitalea sp. G-6-1-2]|uniref:DUF4249 family protein n=1 Tax=Pseudoflavitalea sp. G-6-1-2 TaxID=2728841 RepID=UPI00146BF0D1|nr:DUF4249 family protein [Pseudoflavitalea sp. G-6-1-2]NML21505.1 DUF4249 domain-containing protein [Pseudoflavitalea sp. G-6-1-2]
MQRKKYIFHALMLLLLLPAFSCRKNFIPDASEDDKLVILSEATAGDLVRIPIGRTIRAGAGNLLQFEKVNDATVVLTEEHGGKWLLKADKSPQFENNPTSVFTVKHYFKPGGNYTLEVSHPVLGAARANTIIPAPVNIEKLDTSSNVHQLKPVLQVKLKLVDLAETQELYVIEALKQVLKVRTTFSYKGTKYDMATEVAQTLYAQVKSEPGVKLVKDTVAQQKFLRLDLYTNDKNIDNIRFDNPDNPYRRIFLTDSHFENNKYELNFGIDKTYFTTDSTELKGRVLLQIKSVSRELYRYLVTYEKYKTDFGSVPANELISPVGNIQSGLGVFGGSSQIEKRYYFDEL